MTPQTFNSAVVSLAIYLPLLAVAGCTDDTVCRPASEQEIRSKLKSLANKELPNGVKNLRGLTFEYGGIEELYFSFEADEGTCARVCEQFDGEAVERYQFPEPGNNPLNWGLASFERGHEFEEGLGVDLFDIELTRRIVRDDLQNLHTGQFPPDAVRGRYLKFGTASKTEVKNFHVLVFTDQGLVYVAAARRPEGVFLR